MDSQRKTEEHTNKNHWFHQVLLERELKSQNEFKQQFFIEKHATSYLKEDLQTFMQSKTCGLKLAMQSLDPQERAALILHFQQNYSLHTVAQMLGLSTEALMRLFDHLSVKLQQRFINCHCL